MELKANLHLHTADDPQDFVAYSFYRGIDEAARLGFEVIALTCHHKFVDLPAYAAYAAKQNILLVNGVERNIEKKHVVILNPQKDVEEVDDFWKLAAYRKLHPEIFVLAPHPYFGANYCLGKKLEEHLELFDAVESSWFFSKQIDRNRKAETVARKNNLPFIATSDTHFLKPLGRSYALIEAREKTIPAVFEAIRNGKFENHSEPSKFLSEMLWPVMKGKMETLLYKNRLK